MPHVSPIVTALFAGLLVAIFITTLPLAVSAFTTRRAFAAAFVIGLFIISIAAAEIMTACDGNNGMEPQGKCEPLTGDAAKWLGLVKMGLGPTNVNDKIFGVDDERQHSRLSAELPSIVPIGWYVLVTGGLAFVLWSRYKRLSV